MKRAATRAKVAGTKAKRTVPTSVADKRATAVAKRSGTSGGHRKGRPLPAPPAGYEYTGHTARLLAPKPVQPVEPSKIRRGLAEAKRQLDDTMDELLRTLTGAYEIKEIKLVASFSADGKFLGFGVGGAASVEITICPCDE